MVATIEREELKAKLDRGDDFVLAEALPEKYYRRVHLPGAVNLPTAKTRELAPGLVPDKATEVVVYCGSFRWTSSKKVARELAAMGYENVREYVGGKKDWMDAGLPTEGEHRQRRTG